MLGSRNPHSKNFPTPMSNRAKCSVCAKPIKLKHESSHDLCYKHYMELIRKNPKTGMGVDTKIKLGLI